MKKIFFLIAALSLFSSVAYGWGTIGHAAIAQIAEDHLEPKARKVLDEYLGGKHLAEVASDADKYRKVWLHDIGQEISNPGVLRLGKWREELADVPTNMEPYSHSFTVDEENQCLRYCILDGKYYVNSVMELSEIIKDLKAHAANMDPEERSTKIRLVIHLIGDMHCPGHVSYTSSKVKVKGGSTTAIVIGEKKTTLHKFWDSGIFSMAFPGLKYDGVAKLADTARKKDIKKITRGDVFDWGHDSAESALAGRTYQGERIQKGQNLPASFPDDMKPLCLSQIRKGGYRLAAQLNELFGGK